MLVNGDSINPPKSTSLNSSNNLTSYNEWARQNPVEAEQLRKLRIENSDILDNYSELKEDKREQSTQSTSSTPQVSVSQNKGKVTFMNSDLSESFSL